MNFDLVVRSLLCKIFAAHFKLYSLSQQNLIGIFIVSALKYGQHNLCNKVKNGLLEIFKIIGLSEMPKLFYWFFKNTKNEKRKRYLSELGYNEICYNEQNFQSQMIILQHKSTRL